MVQSGSTHNQLYDVIVVGAGPVGSALAWKLAADGYRVCVCEEHQTVPQTLRLEELSHHVVNLYRELGIFEKIRPALIPLDSIAHFRNGHLVQASREAPYAARYDQLTESLRPALSKVATLVWDTAVQVSAEGRVKSVRLKSGRVICGWMVVVATGGDGTTGKLLSLPEKPVCPHYSLNFAWDLELEDAERMSHPALVFRSTHTGHGYGYLKLFAHEGSPIRANFLSYWRPEDKRRRALLQDDALAVLNRTVEGLVPYVGPFRITSPIEESVLHLNRPQGAGEAGILLAGDACGQVAPSSGMGLRKGLNDVRVLAQLMPQWERESRSGGETLAAYYTHRAKVALDEEAVARSLRERKVAIDWRPEFATRRLIGDQIPDWLESAVVRPAIEQSLNFVRIYRSGLDN